MILDISLGPLHVCTHMCMCIHIHAKYTQKHTYINGKGGENLCRVYLQQKTVIHSITLRHLPGPQNIWVNNSCPTRAVSHRYAFGENDFSLRQAWYTQRKFSPCLCPHVTQPLPILPALRCPNFAKVDTQTSGCNRECPKPMCLVWRGHGSRPREHVMGPCSAGLAPRLGRFAFSRARLPELSKDSTEQSHPCSYQVSVFWPVMVLLIQGNWQDHLACLPVWY